MTLRILAVVAIATIALTGCSGGGDHALDAAASPTASSNEHAAMELAKCMRANGHPNFPDPVKDDQGRWIFPTDAIGDWQPAEACRPLVRDWKIAFSDEKTVTPEDATKLREYAACMREHGLGDWPDPDADGNVELPDRLRVLVDNEDPAFTAAHQACRSHLPPKAETKAR